jgi:C4-dicarboxylate transporter DctQ subunit
MSSIHTLSTILSACIKSILGSIMIFASLLLFINVIMRYIFLAPIFWAEELARYLMVWLIFLGASEVAGAEGHISVNILTKFLGPGGTTFMRRLVSILCCIFCVILTYYSWRHTMRVRSAHQITAALDLPMWWAYLAIPAGSALMALRYALELFRDKEPAP